MRGARLGAGTPGLITARAFGLLSPYLRLGAAALSSGVHSRSGRYNRNEERRAGGELYEKLANNRVRCFACGHRCLIPPGFGGVCRVRFNEEGVLKVPWGYVGALQLDPVEKKPFFHALPGSRALSFGMLGCDYHCGYCFTGDTVVVTDQGPTTFVDLFASCARTEQRPDAEVAFPRDRRVVAGSGRLRPLRGVVRHRYRGELITIRPL